MRDEKFLQGVLSRVILVGSGDTLLCDLRTIHRRTRSGLRTRYEVLRVWEHRLGQASGA